MINLQDKAAVTNADRFLGQLCWYTIHDSVRVTREELEELFKESGVDMKHLPGPVRPVDVFRRATSKVERTGIPLDKERSLNLLTREVKSDRDGVARQLVIEEVDSRNVRLKYNTAATLLYKRDTENVIPVMHSDDTLVKEAVEAALAHYKELLGRYDGTHIRRLVAKILATMNPTAVRPSGGVLFVPEKYKDELASLQRLVQGLRCEFYSVPLVDSRDIREMVYDKLNEQVNETLKVLAEALKSEGLTQKKVGALLTDAKTLLDSVREYEEVLEKDLSSLRSKVELVKMQMLSLLNADAVA